MQINSIKNQPNFKGKIGRFDLDNKKVFTRMYNSLDFSAQNSLRRTFQLSENQKNEQLIKNAPFAKKLKWFFRPKSKPQPIKVELDTVPSRLKQAWADATTAIKESVVKKLPGDYTLTCKTCPSRGANSIDFNLLHGDKKVYGYGTGIYHLDSLDPSSMKKVIELISDPKYALKIRQLKEIIPNLDEHDYLLWNKELSRPEIADAVRVKKELVNKAQQKKLNFNMALSRNQWREYENLNGILSDKKGKVVYQELCDLKGLAIFEKTMLHKIDAAK